MPGLSTDASAEEAGYSFVKENTMSGFAHYADAFMSGSLESICILTYDTISIVNITSMRILAQQRFDDLYFKGGCWVNESIYAAVSPRDPQHDQVDDVLVLSSRDLTRVAGFSTSSLQIYRLVASPDGAHIATFTYKGLYVFNRDTFTLEYEFGGHSADVDQVAWSPDGTRLASVGGDLWVHDVEAGTQERVASGYMHSRGIFWDPGGTLIYNIFSPGDETLDCYDVDTHERVSSTELTYTVNAWAMNLERNDICLGVESQMEILSLGWGRVVYKNSDAAQDIRYIFWSWDGYRIVSVADDGVLRSFVDENHELYNEPPRIDIQNPQSGDVVESSFVARGTITDDSGSAIGFYQLNSRPWQLLADPLAWSFEVNVSMLSPGRNQISIKATDGEKENFTQVAFFYYTDASRPTVEILSPDNGSRVGRVVAIEGRAHDSLGSPLTVLVRVDGCPWLAAGVSTQWRYTTIVQSDVPRDVIVEAKAFNGVLESEVRSLMLHFEPGVTTGNQRPVLHITHPVEGEEVVFDIACAGEVVDENATVMTMYSFDGSSWSLLSSTKTVSGSIPISRMSSGVVRIHLISFDGELLSNEVVVNVTKVIYHIPEVTITQPTKGASIQTDLTMRGYVTGGYGDDIRVEVRLNDRAWEVANGSRFWNHLFNETQLLKGHNTVDIRAYDTYTTSEVVTITVEYLDMFYVVIDSPDTDTHVRDDVEVSGYVVCKEDRNFTVEMRLNEGEWFNVSNATSWTYLLELSNLRVGNNTVDARALDDTGYSRVTSIVVVLDDDEQRSDDATQWLFILVPILIVIVVVLYSLYRSKGNG